MLGQDIGELKRLDEAGYRIAVASGKPVYYLCGFMRQIGGRSPILVGENGATFQFGVDLPPKIYFSYPCSDLARRQLGWVKEKVDEVCGDGVWYQPNDVAVTPFPKRPEIFDVIQELVDTHPAELSELHVYRHSDSFDIAPANVSKYNSLDYLTKYLSLSASDVIAYGDWTNDIPMFEFADISVGVGGKLDNRTDYSFETIGSAARHQQDIHMMNKNALLSAPPMGWNSYDYYNTEVNEEQVRANARYLAENLKAYGWEYVVVDNQWYAVGAWTV